MNRMQKICILIIHGIGEQGKFETLDHFTRNLVNSLRNTGEETITLTHHRTRLQDEIGDYIEVMDEQDPSIKLDVHEYYWAHNMQGVITFREIVEWLMEASDGAEKFYDENLDLVRKHEAFEDGKFKKRWYLKHIGSFLRLLYSAGVLTRVMVPSFLDPLVRFFMDKPTRLLIDYIGDVAIYTSTDMKSKFYEVRQRVLQGAINKITSLLMGDYDKILVVGHSLGSVIAYDALNQINLQMNGDSELAAKRGKLTDFVSMGSPLDKVAFFFREHIPEGEYVKRLVLNNVNAYRRKDVTNPVQADLIVKSNVQDLLAHMRWTNYWDRKDPISGPLDFYTGVTNIEIDNGLGWGTAHVGYWSNRQIYREAVERARIGMPQCRLIDADTAVQEEILLLHEGHAS